MLGKYSGTSYTIAAFTLASGHPGLELKRLYFSVLYSRGYKNTTTGSGSTQVTVYTRCELIYGIGLANTHLHL